MVRRYSPERGDLVWLQFNPQLGHEQSGRRPALVVSPRQYNQKVGMALFCPITSKVKGYPFEVALDEGLEIQGAILSDLVKSLDWQTREAKLIGRVSEATVSEVRAKIHTLI